MEVYVVGDIFDLGRSGGVNLRVEDNATVDSVMSAIEKDKRIPKSKQRIYHDGRLLDKRNLRLSTLHRWEGRPLKLYVMFMDKDCGEFRDGGAGADEDRAAGWCSLM